MAGTQCVRGRVVKGGWSNGWGQNFQGTDLASMAPKYLVTNWVSGAVIIEMGHIG